MSENIKVTTNGKETPQTGDAPSNVFNATPQQMYNKMMCQIDPDKEEQYRKFGEYFFNTVDVDNCKVKKPEELPPVHQLVLYATEGLKSGLHPRDLSNDELEALFQIVGPVWLERFGFNFSDLPESFTFTPKTENVVKHEKERKKTHTKKYVKK